MADYLIKGETLTGIADAIRSKTGSTDPVAVSSMASQIEGIEAGGVDVTILDNVPIEPDFSNGNQVVDAGEGYAVRKATIIKPATLTPENVAAGIEIAGVVGTHAGGELPSDVHAVTFMNGNEVLWVRHVADGDNCADVVTKGLIPTPTKESTAQYDYAYNGWGATDNGSVNSTILQNITADKTVYAIYKATAKTYTITFYDADGVTVLTTKTVAYGTTPSYTPHKDNYMFTGWTPELALVTGDASYVACWEESVSFADMSWDKIAEVAANGKAKEYFAVGDTKTIYNTAGNFYCNVRIIGFDHDDLADGSGKAAITCALTHVASTYGIAPKNVCNNKYYADSPLRTSVASSYATNITNFTGGVVKSVIKPCYSSTTAATTITDVLWPLSTAELNAETNRLDGTAYEYYEKDMPGFGLSGRILKDSGGTTAYNYYTRSMMNNNITYITASGSMSTYPGSSTSTSYKACIHFGFCI